MFKKRDKVIVSGTFNGVFVSLTEGGHLSVDSSAADVKVSEISVDGRQVVSLKQGQKGYRENDSDILVDDSIPSHEKISAALKAAEQKQKPFLSQRSKAMLTGAAYVWVSQVIYHLVDRFIF